MNPFLTLILTIVALFLLWPWPVMAPLKLLVVFFHEASHALMTVLTGGRVVEMTINAQQGGHVLSAGGSRFLTLSAGYLGSLLWGAVIYLAAVKSRFDKALSAILGVTILGICAWFIRDLFALVFCAVTGLGMLLMASKASMAVNDAVLRVIGLTSMLYAPLDIYSDTIERSNLRSDAVMLAEEFWGSGIFWGGAWLVLSVGIIAITFITGLRTRSGSTRSSVRGPSFMD